MNIWYILMPLLLAIAFANAYYYKQHGYKFWLTFLFSLLMVLGFFGILMKALGYV